MALRFASVGLRSRLNLGLGSPKLQQTMRGPQVIAQASMSSSSLGKAEMIEIVAQKAGVSKETAKNVLEAFTDTVVNAVAKDQKVTLVGFGSFERTVRAARTGRNPQTGAALEIPEKAGPTFKAGKQFKDTVAAAHK